MKTLSPKSQKWLKALHLCFVAMWVGGGIALVLMVRFMGAAEFDMELYGVNRAMRFVDDFIIIPGAFGCLLTGLVYSVWTRWGFIRHGWIACKWVINIGGILFGTFFLGPWLNSLGPMALDQGLQALSDPVYLHNLQMNATWAPVQVATLVLAVFLSTLKPWKNWTGR
ncbi:MAG: hypothetical protein ACOC24_08060 [Desulfovibrionales bacterium]